jgi:hypothetical protein
VIVHGDSREGDQCGHGEQPDAPAREKKSKWERQAQYQKNAENHIKIREEVDPEDPRQTIITKTAGKSYFNAVKHFARNARQFARQRGDK